MFCKYCESLDLDAATAATPWSGSGAPHHESFADLVASAANGCELCQRIADTTRKENPEKSEEELHDRVDSGRIYYFYDREDSSLYWRIGELIGFPGGYICAAKGQPSISASDIG